MNLPENPAAVLLCERQIANKSTALLAMQKLLQSKGLNRSHCAVALNILAQWQHQPSRPISLRDWQRLYGLSLTTGRKLLAALSSELGLTAERFQDSNGGDAGYLLINNQEVA